MGGTGSIAVASVIDRVNLQFWSLSRTQTLVNQVDGDLTEQVIAAAKERGVAPFLCVVNDEGSGFSWPLVRDVLGSDGGATLRALILRAVDSLGMAGVDLNWEATGGDEPFPDTDLLQLTALLKPLADSLHARGKLLTMPTFPNNNLAPKIGWIGAMAAAGVDQLLPMALDSRWGGGAATSGYAELLARADSSDLDPALLQPILPLWLDTWGGQPALASVRWLRHCHTGGIGAYALHSLAEGKWQDPALWQEIAAMRSSAPDFVGCDTDLGDPNIVDTLGQLGSNPRGGLWIADSDIWSRLGLTSRYSAVDTAANSAWKAATRIWNSAQDYDLAVQMSRWADISRAYTDAPGGGRLMETKIVVSSPVDPTSTAPWAGAALIHEFEPRDCSDPSYACWMVEHTGVSRELSGYDSLVVGLRCDAGKQVRVALTQKESVVDNYGADHLCSGAWEDVSISLAHPTPLSGAPAAGWSATRAFRVSIGFTNDGTPDSVAIAVAGVALDRSVLQLRAGALGL